VKRTLDPDLLLLQGAADPTRLGILRQLADEGTVCACNFTACCNVSQPTVSHHLKVLRETGWLTSERRGTWIWYSLRPEAGARIAQIGAGLAVAVKRPATELSRTSRPSARSIPSEPADPMGAAGKLA
jgi:arsenate reductase